jgi:RNA 2',3'-cyclic 3'-phosphodiesterase
MHLFAALVPPRNVVDHVSQVVAAVRPEREPVGDPSQTGRHAGWSGRRFGRRRQEQPPVEPPKQMLDLVPPVRMHVPIAKFGNLALTDAHRLTDAMVEQARDWGAPRLHLRGGVALEPEGDTSVWARLAGDLDELNAAVRGVSRVAQGLHLFVDRRVFRPHVRLGTINDHTTEAYLEELLSTLDALEGPSWWQVSLSLVVPAELGPHQPTYKLHEDIPLGPPVAH